MKRLFLYSEFFMIRNIFLLAIISLLISSCSIHKLKEKSVYKELSPKEYYAYVKDSSVNIIDVRSAHEYEDYHIKGAVNVSYFGGNFKEELNKQNLDTTKTTLIYCQTQHRSLMVANKIYKAGFANIIDLDKGMRVWYKNDFPTVTPDTLE